MPAKCPSFLELAHLVISLLCGNKPVSYSYKLVYQSTLLVVGYKTVTICGTLGALSSIGCLFYPGPNQILIFAPVFIFMMVIPGHVLNHAARKQKKS